MATAWTLTIGGTMQQGGIVTGGGDYSQFCDFQSVRVYYSNRMRGSHASLKLYLNANQPTSRPRCLQLVVVRNNTLNYNLWAGIIQTVDQAEQNGATWEYTLTMSDLTRWLDHVPAGNLRQYPINSADTMDVTVRNVINDWVTPGTLVGQQYGALPPLPTIYTDAHVVSAGTSIQAYNPNFQMVSQVIDYLARVGDCVWFIDANAELWFIPAYNTSSPSAFLYAPITTYGTLTYYDMQTLSQVTLNNFPILDADNDVSLSTKSQYRNLTLTEDSSTTISAVTVGGFLEVTTVQLTEGPTAAIAPADINLGLVGTGLQQTFVLNQIPVNNVKYMTVTATIANGGGTSSVVTFNQANGNLLREYIDGGNPGDAATATATCYVNYSGKNIRFNGPNAGKVVAGTYTGIKGAPDNATNITVVYNYYFPSAYQYIQGTSSTSAIPTLASVIAGREGFGPGNYFDIIQDATLTTPITIADGTPQWAAAATLDIARYGILRIGAQFNSYISGWLPNQIFGITSTARGDAIDSPDGSYTGWNSTFSQRFFVTDVQIAIINDTTCDYTIKASNSLWGA